MMSELPVPFLLRFLESASSERDQTGGAQTSTQTGDGNGPTTTDSVEDEDEDEHSAFAGWRSACRSGERGVGTSGRMGSLL